MMSCSSAKLLFLLSLWRWESSFVFSLALPSSPTRQLSSSAGRQPVFVGSAAAGIGLVLATTTSLLVPTSAQAAEASGNAETIKINADIPALVQIAKDNQDVLLKLAQQAASAVSINEYPKNWLEFARDAAAGDVSIEINGIPIDISLLSEKGAIDVDLSLPLQQADASVTLSSKLLPKLPFLSKRTVSTTAATTAASSTSSSSSDAVAPTTDVAEGGFSINPLDYGYTLEQVVGSAALGLGGVYGLSYAYYLQSGAEEERAAQAKRTAAAAAAAAKKKAAKPAPAAAPKPDTEPKKNMETVKAAKDTTEAEPVVEKPQAVVAAMAVAETVPQAAAAAATAAPPKPAADPTPTKAKNNWRFWKTER